jgi:uncharacterized protein
MRLQYNYPFRINKLGRTEAVNQEQHIRQLIEQVLFTIQGERVNRPTFGSNINQLVFAPNSDVLSTATQALVQGSLQQWLGDLITVESVEVQNQDSTLRIAVHYFVIRNQQQRQVVNFSWDVK